MSGEQDSFTLRNLLLARVTVTGSYCYWARALLLGFRCKALNEQEQDIQHRRVFVALAPAQRQLQLQLIWSGAACARAAERGDAPRGRGENGLIKKNDYITRAPISEPA